MNKSGTKVGKVVKPSAGAWKVMKGTTKVALAKANGTSKYPVNLYNLSGKRIGRCGIIDGAWRVEKITPIPGGNAITILAKVPKGCPGRAAIGAVRLVYRPK